MRPHTPSRLDKKHPHVARDAMEDIKNLASDPNPVRNEIRYVGANRDRALGEADRTGRHYDETRRQTGRRGAHRGLERPRSRLI